MQKIFSIICIFAILEIGQSVLANNKAGLVRRDVDNLPAEEDAQIIVKIKDSVTRLRHAEARLKTFLDRIDDGLQSGAVAKTLEAVQSQVEKGELDFSKITSAFKTDAPKNFRELIKRISDDTHILLDQLHGRLDSVGNLIKDVKHDSDDTSAEDHHEAKEA